MVELGWQAKLDRIWALQEQIASRPTAAAPAVEEIAPGRGLKLIMQQLLHKSTTGKPYVLSSGKRFYASNSDRPCAPGNTQVRE